MAGGVASPPAGAPLAERPWQPGRATAGLLAFCRLDMLLASAVTAARIRYLDASADAFRGMYVSAEQADRSLDIPPGEPLLAAAQATGADGELPGWDLVAADNPRWEWLREAHGLSDLELDAVLIALGPDVDRRYERLYGYLQDDVTCRRPTVNLVLDLMTSEPAGRLAAFGRFRPGAPLLRGRVIELHPDPRAVAPALIAHQIALDEQVAAALLHQEHPDRRLAAFCELVPVAPAGGEPDAEPVPGPADLPALTGLVADAWGRRPLRLCFHGRRGTGRSRAARALARSRGAPLLRVDAGQLPPDPLELADTLVLVLREARLHGALMHLEGADALFLDDGSTRREALAAALAAFQGVVVMSGRHPWAPWGQRPLGVLNVAFAEPAAGDRREGWRRALARAGAEAPAADLDALADRFRLSGGEITDSVLTAVAAAGLRSAEPDAGTDRGPTRDDLFAAARGRRGHELEALARRIEPTYGWDDIVLAADPLGQLHDLCERVAQRRRVLEDWGFGRKLPRGRGTSALFAGPPGTGKTMAAEVIARELGVDLFAIDLSMVVSKYIGETEKNLERVFGAADGADAILLFDEADALFGKRSEVRDAHDRYANVEIAFLLQRMEQYEGLAILSTNLRQNLDDAFTRRLQFVVEFPVPDDVERRRIWEVCFPPDAPRDPAIDLDRLAGFRLAGGSIRNIVLAAAFTAAAQGVPIGMDHLIRATRREHQKMGRVLPESEFVAEPGRG